MKILLISPVGETPHIRRIPAALAQDDQVELTVVAPEKVRTERTHHPSGWFCLESEEDVNGYRLIPVPLKDPYDFSQGFESNPLQRVIRNVKPDIIQVWGGPTARWLFQVVWLKLRAWQKAKVVFYGFDNLSIHLGKYSRLKWRITWTQVAGGVEADSEGVENVRHAGFSGPMERIFWGISTDIFKCMDNIDKPELKRGLGLDCNHIVGYIGRLVPEKGLHVLLAAISRLPSNVHGVIIGSGPMRAELELWSEVSNLTGRVHLIDPMPPQMLVKYMNCMDVLTLPSLTTPHWKEQYGRVIGEAMACGVPVVGSDSGAIPEVIGDVGLITPEGDPVALAQALETAIFDAQVREKLIPAGLQRAERELSVRAMSQRLLDFYIRILERNK